MEERITKELGDRDIASIKELNLDNCKSSNVTGLSEDWKSLEDLNLINVGLSNLKGFPRLPNLKKLELSDNNLCEGFDALACLPKLEELNLSGNKIKDLDAFEPLSQVETLKKLSLFGCDICKVENYRKKLFALIPSLTSLDGLGKISEAKVKNGAENENGKKEELSDSASDEDDSIDDDDDDDDDEEDDDEEGEDDDIPLEALYNKINDEGDDDDFEVVEDEEDEDIDEEEDEEDSSINVSKENEEETEEVRGTKRKHEEEK